MRNTTLTLPAADLFGRALQIATFAGTQPTSSRAPAGAATPSLLARLDAWFARQEQRERDAYLAQSEDIFDVERRIRHLERRGSY